MIRNFNGKRFYWLMSYMEKAEALERAEKYRSSAEHSFARVTRSRRGFYEVWGSQALGGGLA